MGELLDRKCMVNPSGMKPQMKLNMKRSIVFAFICLFGLSIVSVSVKAQTGGAIYINADGSITGTSLIQRQGNMYLLTNNIYDLPIIVYCGNIVFDGEGHILQGAGGWGTPGTAGVEKKLQYILNAAT